MRTRIGLALFAIGILIYTLIPKNDPIADLQDIDTSLTNAPRTSAWLQEDIAFWQSKLDKSPGEFSYKAKLAGAYGLSFSETGAFDELFKAASLWDQVNQQTHYKEASFLRAAAKNAISLHEFKKAESLLLKAEKLGEGLTATQLMQFDVAMELAKYDQAEKLLEDLADPSNVDYLIRLSKWNDYKGELSEAIYLLEQVHDWAQQRKNEKLEFWAITNLGDYYGHAGTIKKAYQAYLEALRIDPSSVYAKKGIAYIAFAHDNQPKKALQIIQSIKGYETNPDLLLLSADIYDHMGDSKKRLQQHNTFIEQVASQGLEVLYRMPLASILAEEFQQYDTALDLARAEVAHRATPETYDLLAWIYYLNGDLDKAVALTENKVWGKSKEPVLLLHSAQILKAAGKLSSAAKIKEELLEASFELGPKSKREVMSL